MNRAYAYALSSLAAKDGASHKKIADGLIRHLKARGRLKLLPRIASELRVMTLRKHALAPSVEAASEHEKTAAIRAAKAAGIEAKTITVNPSLIRGFRVRSGGTLLDRSGKRALVDLYRKIIR